MEKSLSRSRFTVGAAVYVLYAAVGFFLFVLLYFFPGISYAYREEFRNPFLLSFLGLGLFSALYFCLRKASIPGALVLILAGLFLGFQIVIVKSYFFCTSWDSEAIVHTAQKFCKKIGQVEFWYTDYFSRYPNNYLILFCTTQVLKLGTELGFSVQQSYASLWIIQCVISALTGLLTFRLAARLTQNRPLAFVVYLFYLLLIGLSPWVSIPYSDSPGLLFPVLLLSLYTAQPSRPCLRVLRWAAIGFLAYVGYKFKPTVMIVLIAITLFELSALFEGRRFFPILGKLSLLLTGLVIAHFLLLPAVAFPDWELNREARFGTAHFLAMGMNEQHAGAYCIDDVNYSAHFKTIAERDAADWALAKSRISEMGFLRLLKHCARKLLTNYNDGTFAWTHEGGFFRLVFERDDWLSRFTRSFYYTDGSRRAVFWNGEQALWLTTLLLSFGAVLSKPQKGPAVLMLSLLGMVLYSMLFEARARYVYVFAPLYLALAGLGFSALLERLGMYYSARRLDP